MSTIPTDQLKPADLAHLSCTYAALILHDEGIAVEADKLKVLLNAANIKIDAFFCNLYAKVLATRNIGDLLLPTGGGSSGPVATDTGATGAPAAKEEEKKEEKVEEEEDVDMGGMFGDEDEF